MLGIRGSAQAGVRPRQIEMRQQLRRLQSQDGLQRLNGSSIVLQLHLAVSQSQQQLDVIPLHRPDVLERILGLLPFRELQLHIGKQTHRIHIAGRGRRSSSGILFGVGEIHQSVMRTRDVIVEQGQARVELLSLEQPPESRLSIFRAAQQFSILLQDRGIIRFQLRALANGPQAPGHLARSSDRPGPGNSAHLRRRGES